MNIDEIRRAVSNHIETNRARYTRALMRDGKVRRALTEQEAQDAVQQAWIDLNKKISDGSFEWRGGDIGGYVFRAVELAALNLVRGHRRRKDTAPVNAVLQDETVEPATKVGSLDDPVASSEARERQAWIERALASLEPLRRNVLLLRIFAEKTLEEIAEMLAVTVSKVRTAFQNGIVDLQRHLPPDGHLAEPGEPLQVVFLGLNGDVHRLAVALRPQPVTDDDGRLGFRMLAPSPDTAPPVHTFALLRLDDGQVVHGARPAVVTLRRDPEDRESWLAHLDVRQFDGSPPRPGARLVGVWLFALPKAPPVDIGQLDSPTP